MVDIIIGAVITGGFISVISYSRKHNLRLKFLHWLVTVFGFLYTLFVLKTIAGFIAEGTYKGAAVMGCLLGFIAVVWAILLKRFVFTGIKIMNNK
ncbi:hypothetical protein ACFL6G_08425 [candidate division KSB1 bacterium]